MPTGATKNGRYGPAIFYLRRTLSVETDHAMQPADGSATDIIPKFSTAWAGTAGYRTLCFV